MYTSKILLGSDQFMNRLDAIAKTANTSFLVQTMTFEGDRAGEWLIKIIQSSPARDKRLLLDHYSNVVVNDHFVVSGKYLFDAGFRSEIRNTKKLIKNARKAGIEVKFTNPVGFLGQKYPLRNHKKLVIVDGKYSYLGGINFSDHNFKWHDMMIELKDEKVGKSLTQDFDHTWNGKNQSKKIELDSSELYFFNGRKSTILYQDFFDHLRMAKKSIKIISPYVSEPLFSVLREISKNGAKVSIISPSENNKSIFRNLILSEFRKGYFELKEFEGMSHMKAILIDDEKLIFGSSNYDVISYYFEQEIVMISKDIDLILDFKSKVLAETKDIEEVNISPFASWKAGFLMKALNGFSKFASATFLKTV